MSYKYHVRKRAPGGGSYPAPRRLPHNEMERTDSSELHHDMAEAMLASLLRAVTASRRSTPAWTFLLMLQSATLLCMTLVMLYFVHRMD